MDNDEMKAVNFNLEIADNINFEIYQKPSDIPKGLYRAVLKYETDEDSLIVELTCVELKIHDKQK